MSKCHKEYFETNPKLFRQNNITLLVISLTSRFLLESSNRKYLIKNINSKTSREMISDDQ